MFEVKTGVFRGSGITVVFLRHKVFVECINEKGERKLCFFLPGQCPKLVAT